MIDIYLSWSIVTWTPGVDYKSFSDRIFSIESSIMWISRGNIFKVKILVEVFDPPFLCTSSILSLVQSQTVPTISTLLPSLSVEHLYMMMQLIGILFGASACVKLMWICNTLVSLLSLLPLWKLLSGQLNDMCPDLPHLYQVYCMLVQSIPGTRSVFCWYFFRSSLVTY